VIIAVAALAFYFWGGGRPASKSETDIDKIIGTALTEVEVVTNPLEKTPEVNPIEKANPFSKVYKNPFE